MNNSYGELKKEQEPQYVFTYAENQPEDYPTTLGAYKFAELVEETTNGRIKILVQAEGILGDEKSVIEQVQYGGIDFARVSLSPLSEIIPKLNVLQMPLNPYSNRLMFEAILASNDIIITAPFIPEPGSFIGSKFC